MDIYSRNDGYGVIPVEVGNMEAGKWSGITIGDDHLSTLIEHYGYLIHATRGSSGQLMKFYAARLHPSFHSLPLFP
jgi:hypothetical protein